MYPPSSNPFLASLGRLAGASSSLGAAPTSMRDDIFGSMALSGGHQDQALGGPPPLWTNPFPSLSGGLDSVGGLAGGGSVGLQSAAATEASRRLVRNLMHPSPAGTRDGTDASEDSRGNIGSGSER
jgi:hypothetical protein